MNDTELETGTATPMPAPGCIVVGVDGSGSSLDAVAWAAAQSGVGAKSFCEPRSW